MVCVIQKYLFFIIYLYLLHIRTIFTALYKMIYVNFGLWIFKCWQVGLYCTSSSNVFNLKDFVNDIILYWNFYKYLNLFLYIFFISVWKINAIKQLLHFIFIHCLMLSLSHNLLIYFFTPSFLLFHFFTFLYLCFMNFL